MNDITYVEAARVFAERILRTSDDVDDRIRQAFSEATGRSPNADESQILRRKLDQLLSSFKANAEAAEKLASAGESARQENLPAVEVAAYASLCNLILNLDEVITKE
jgi:hypothetical protein